MSEPTGPTIDQRIETIRANALVELAYARRALDAIESELSSRFVAHDYVAEKAAKVSSTVARLPAQAKYIQQLQNDRHIAGTYVRAAKGE